MEHIRHTIVGPAGHDATALQVIGAINDVLGAHQDFSGELSAVAWQAPRAILRSVSSAATALVRQQENDILNEINTLLRRRFGGPEVQQLIVRPATES